MIVNAPESKSGCTPPADGIYRCGTLTYTKFSLAILFCWLLWGDFCYMLMETVVPSILPLKFRALGASNTAIGLILTTIPMIINSVCNPIISFKSDRHRSKWGRRIPFILFTMPVTVFFLLCVGFADRIAIWLHGWLGSTTFGLSDTQFAVVLIGIMMVAFSFFNTFVNSVFWYLFNDVVPEHLLARFMSWFRIVSMIASALYNFFIFRYAQSHAVEIFIGAAILYFIGFGLMCLNVKEGEYPPPPANVEGKSGFLAGVITFAKGCHSQPHYIYIFLVGMCFAGAGAVGPFNMLFLLSLGLDVADIGKISGVGCFVMGAMIAISGWLADRYHPTRIVILGVALQILLAIPAAMTWLFYHPDPNTAFWLYLTIAVCLNAPIGALIGVLDPPMFMRLFPRSLYGQFCSANAMWRSISLIINGTLIGIFFDLIGGYVGKERAYAFIPVWQLLFYLLMLFFLCKVYKGWQRLGGDDNYVAVVPDFGHAAPGVIPVTEPEFVTAGELAEEYAVAESEDDKK